MFFMVPTVTLHSYACKYSVGSYNNKGFPWQFQLPSHHHIIFTLNLLNVMISAITIYHTKKKWVKKHTFFQFHLYNTMVDIFNLDTDTEHEIFHSGKDVKTSIHNPKYTPNTLLYYIKSSQVPWQGTYIFYTIHSCIS